MSDLHLLVPEGVDDASRPSGGNVYDRHLGQGLAALGWRVREHAVPGPWPVPMTAGTAALRAAVCGLADGATVLIDGLVASASPDVLVPAARRLGLVVLLHTPWGAGHPLPGAATVAAERAVLAAAAAVVTTSRWTQRWVIEHYQVPSARVTVAEPGVAWARPAPGTPDGGALLTVAAMASHKGHDVLLRALADLRGLTWCWTCVGPATEAAQVASLRREAERAGLAERVHLTGPLVGDDLDAVYDASDLLVLPSREESYGMVVAEALAHGLPVVASDVGGIPDALGQAPSGGRPGLLVSPGDPRALAGALSQWLGDDELRRRLRHLARARRATLQDWSSTAAVVSHVLAGVSP